MPLLLLIRHGENDFVKKGRLAGRIPGVRLNEKGAKQADALADALKDVPLKAIYSSTLERALDTAKPIARARSLQIIREPDLRDSDIGAWQGKSLAMLRLRREWRIVQNSPSRFRFPAGESFVEMQTRVVGVLERIVRTHNKTRDVVAAVFHADPIRLAVAHFLGLPLDNFQRLSCDTGSVTALYVSESGANLLKFNQRPPLDFLRRKK